MNTASHRLAWLSVLVAAAALAACNRKEEAPAPAPATSAPAAAAPAATPAGPIIAPVQVAAPTEAQRTAGATLAAQGAGAAVACNTCHGAQGEGQAAANFPRLAGQSRTYLQHELESYADGSRKNPIMQPIAAALTPEQRVAAAVYFAALPPGAPTAAGAQSANDAKGGGGGRGNQLASTGDDGKGVQACANCHGPGGIGSGELYPYLAGQHAGYLSATLAAWRDGTRNNDPSGQMPVIAKALAPEDVAALAAYYAAQPLRATPIGSERMAAPAFAPASAVQSGPQTQMAGAGASTAPAAAAGGAGITQGAGTTGGGQGAGGGGGTGPTSTGNPAAGAGAAAPASGTR